MADEKPTIPKVSVSKVCTGLSVDGGMLKLATLGIGAAGIVILDLATIPLPVVENRDRPTDPDQEANKNPFDESSDPDFDGPPELDWTSISEFLRTHWRFGSSYSVGLSDPPIHPMMVTKDAKENLTKFHRRVVAEIQHTHGVVPQKDALAFEFIGKTNALALCRLEPCPVLDVFALPPPGSRRGTRINYLTSTDIALVNLVRAHFHFAPAAIVHIIYVGEEECRLFILRGHDLVYLAPHIQLGSTTVASASMLNNRIELAAESSPYPKADHVVLCGLADEAGLKDEIIANNPDILTHQLSRVRATYFDNQLIEVTRDYLAPISLAWQQLEPKSPHFYRPSVIPHHIRDEQKKLKLAWHGFLLLALLFVATFALTYIVLQKQSRIKETEARLARAQEMIQKQQEVVNQITQLEQQSVALVAAAKTLDTLLLSSEQWTETLDTLSKGTAGLKDLWVNELKPDKEGFEINGFSLSRASIPLFTKRIGDATLKEVSVQIIGKRKVFRYRIILKIPDEYPSGSSPAALWHQAIGSRIDQLGAPPPGGGPR